VHWRILPPARVVFRHEEHFARLRPPAIRNAILTYMTWCDVHYQPSTIHTHRAALLNFFLWFQERDLDRTRLDQVTRAVALDYARYLQSLVTEGTYSPKYRNDLYNDMRLFFEFAIEERLDTAPDRNPFGLRDTPRCPDPIPRYIADHELRKVLEYCHNGAKPKERTVVITLLHTGIRAAELAVLKTTDLVQIQGKWQLHIHEGKGLKDRVIPLTTEALTVLQTWQTSGREHTADYFFTHHGQHWEGAYVRTIVHQIGVHLEITGLTPHRFRHSFAVALLNYGMRESALQKLMGHTTLNMTLEYARILDRTVEQTFNQAVEQMHTGALSWVPSFFAPDDYTLFADGDSLNWIRLPLGYCRRNLKLHCESDVKCLLCDRFCALPTELPRLLEMHQRFLDLGLQVKADVVASHIQRLETQADRDRLPTLLPLPAA